MAMMTCILIAAAAVTGGLTVQGIVGGVAILNATMKFTILAVGFLVLAGICAFLAALLA